MTTTGPRSLARLARTSCAASLFVLWASAGSPQVATTNPGPRAPDFRVQIWGDIAADFSARVQHYRALRTTLEDGLPALALTDNPADITRAELALARRIRIARKGAGQGEIFTPAIAEEFRKVLLPAMTTRTMTMIMDDNPGEFSHRIDGTYPKERTLSTVPANILAILPRLPADIQYRFLGRHLVLHDTRANVIFDQMPCAIQCT